MISKEQTSMTERSIHPSEDINLQADFIQSVAEMMPDVVTVVEIPSRNIIYANRDTMVLLGFDPDEIVGMSYQQRMSLFHPQDLPAIQAFYQRFDELKDSELNVVEYRLQNKAGEWITLLVRAKVFARNLEGKVKEGLLVGQDITMHKHTQQKLQHLENQRRKELFQVILRTQEAERRRISESLHNGLGQLLYGVKLSLSHLLATRVLNNPDLFEKEKAYTDELLTKAIEETRKISHELVPASLRDHGLRAALAEVCKQMNDGVQLECSITGLTGKFDEYLELAIYRIIQELLLNVMRHAKASLAWLKLKVGKKKISIEVGDNGVGFNASPQAKPGIGLASIRNKLDLLNGDFKILPLQGGGTIIKINIPLPDLPNIEQN